MASPTLQIGLWFIFLVGMGLWVEPGLGQGCTNTFFSVLIHLIPCRQAVDSFTPVAPSEACCNVVNALGRDCICILVNGPPISGVDRNLATLLPGKCSANFEPCEVRNLVN